MDSTVDPLATLTLAKLAKRMDIPEWRIRELVNAGKGPPFFKVGRTFRFPLVGVLRWMEEQTSARTEER